MISDPRPDGAGARHFGLYPAIVTDIVDKKHLGRIEVRFPSLGRNAGGQELRAWATLLTPYADDQQGIEILPETGTQVLVAFEAGDLRRPYIVGACWNGKERLPQVPQAANNKRLWRSRAKSLLEFDDTKGAAKLTLKMQSGHTVVLDDGARQVQVRHANGSVITLTSGGQITIRANSTVDITASALNVHCPVANFDGVVNCTTLVASSAVASPSYTPGAGNVW
jgi:uncharacterized protein involved in type VI secretion and phage assembly